MGYGAIDGFFVLTGFLLTQPFFISSPPLHISSRLFYARRLIRLIPVYWFTLFLVFLLFPHGFFPMATVVNEKYQAIAKAAPALVANGWFPHNCTPLTVIANVLFINNHLPFGGCSLHTWSLAIQFQFYLLLPWLVNALVSRVRLWKFAAVMVVLSGLIRMMAYAQLQSLRESSSLFPKSAGVASLIEFYYYINTLTRMGALFMGVLLNQISLSLAESPRAAHRIAPWLQELLGLFVLAVAYIQASHNRVIDTIDEQPLYEFPNFRAIYYVFFGVGGLCSAAMYALVILMAMHRIGTLGIALHHVFSSPSWQPIANWSYIAYLIHPWLIVKIVTTFFFPPTLDNSFFFMLVVLTLSLTFLLSFILHNWIEKPLQRAITNANEQSPRVLSTCYHFCCIAITISIIVHVIIQTAVASCWSVDCIDKLRSMFG